MLAAQLLASHNAAMLLSQLIRMARDTLAGLE
jgi:hypothetical protein